MLSKNMYPIKMLPHPKETVWGGSRLEKYYGKERQGLSNIAESWELSAISGMESCAANGVLTQKNFDEIYKLFNFSSECPILIKFIDSESDLSIQVHPSKKDGDALPKNECWYILSADENSKIAYGFKNATSKEKIDASISDGSICDILNYVKVKPGDFFYVPAGLVHAIGKGITLLEIQQSSDTTYRIFDYNRLDKNGNPRELHIENAKKSIQNFAESEISNLCFSIPCKNESCLCSCDYFSIFEITSQTRCNDLVKDRNASVTFLSKGSVALGVESYEGVVGDTFYIPPHSCSDDLVISASKAILTVF